MKISVIIVNYNVKHFLQQCLQTLLVACKGIDAEIFVVDNNSVDGSCSMVRELFPEVHLIENKENSGFSKANNQALKMAKGEYCLLLNPDTILEEDSLHKILKFADEHPDGGGFGVKMIDGKGHFLPESKRALPTPLVAFYKIFGLSSLFPHSKRFGRYHLGHLNSEENHDVEVLAGAFMLIRRSVLDQIGFLDEDFFMYGEDIDLSYRITMAGYRNYYFAGTTLIHYKGESTKKGSVNYVLVFYKAMIIFAKKHFSHKKFKLFSGLINLAIYVRAFLAILTRFFKKAFLPVLDALIIYAGFLLFVPFWDRALFDGNHYPPEYFDYVIPGYIIVWLASMIAHRVYRKPMAAANLARGLLTGTLFILVIYSLLPENLRFSRALILIGLLWSLISLYSYRLLIHWKKEKFFRFETAGNKKIILIASQEEAQRIEHLLEQISLKTSIVGTVFPGVEEIRNPFYLGNIQSLKEIVFINRIEEIIFSAKDMPAQDIIRTMHLLNDMDVDYKIAPRESISVIGSNSIDTAGDLYVVDNNSVGRKTNLQKKRFFDIVTSLVLLIISPVLLMFQERKGKFFSHIFRVLSGKLSWVSYCNSPQVQSNKLPKLPQGVVTPCMQYKDTNPQFIQKINLIYSKDYTVWKDLLILVRLFRFLG